MEAKKEYEGVTQERKYPEEVLKITRQYRPDLKTVLNDPWFKVGSDKLKKIFKRISKRLDFYKAPADWE
ncbi:hypothetical protein A7U60_g2280 [Sanghuangporus baumii]|uniref:Uncharacterized protein n=1 Tax=Sanghuangporus baumii TaxID=108892 RepID=A0A9Q5I2I4_SANBA|nr:hypothetical protein A7U60_g2280 [Sanghuangporus baumii]